MKKTFEEVMAEVALSIAMKGVIQINDGRTITTWIPCPDGCSCFTCQQERDLRAHGYEPMPRPPSSVIIIKS